MNGFDMFGHQTRMLQVGTAFHSNTVGVKWDAFFGELFRGDSRNERRIQSARQTGTDRTDRRQTFLDGFFECMTKRLSTGGESLQRRTPIRCLEPRRLMPGLHFFCPC